MKRTFLILTVAAQMAAGGAFAQTSNTATGTSGSSATSKTYGSDWSPSLGSAMFSADGTTIRSKSEIGNQWKTLSDEDKKMVRRDCKEDMKQSGGMTGSGSVKDGTGTGSASTTMGSTGTASPATAGSTGVQSGSTSGMSTTGSRAKVSVSHKQMAEICAATKDL